MKKIRYFLEFIIVKLSLKLFQFVSIEQASALGSYLARIIGPHLPVNKIARKNIQMVFKDSSELEVNNIITQMWDNLGRTAAELAQINRISSTEFSKRIKIKGHQHLEAIKKANQPALFFSAHLANWELSPRIIRENQINLSLIYRAANNKAVDKIINNERLINGVKIIAKGNRSPKEIIKYFKDQFSLAMLVDQKMNEGIKVPFFNHPAMTSSSLAKFALNYDYPIIPVQVIRKDKVNFIVQFFPPIKIIKTDDSKQDVFNIMLNINQIIEQWILDNPGQWFWLHKRWL